MPPHRHGAATAACPGMPRNRLADTPEGRAFLAATDQLEDAFFTPPEGDGALPRARFYALAVGWADEAWRELCAAKP